MINKYREKLRQFEFLLWTYNWVRYRSAFSMNMSFRKGRNNKIDLDWVIRNGLKIDINGNNNLVRIGRSSVLNFSKIEIRGDYNIIEIGSDCVIEGTDLVIQDSRCKILIGDRTTIGGAHLAATENDSNIKIGFDCMFASGIEVRTGDSHGIYDSTGCRLNNPKDVTIGAHVWVCTHSSILKGVTIGNGSIVATRSVVTGGNYDHSVILAGAPAKVIRTGITWTRSRLASNPIE